MTRRTVLGGAGAGAAALAASGLAAQSGGGKAPAIDVHTHMYTDGWVKAVQANPDKSTRIVQGPRFLEIDYRGERITRLSPEMTDFELRIRNMDAAGIDIAIISLTAPNVYVESRELALQLTKQINEDFAAASTRYARRVYWLASLPWHFPQDALAELERIKGASHVGFCMLTNILGKPLTDPMFEPIWTAIEKTGLPVFVHPTTPFVDGMGLHDYGLANTIGFTTETSLCFARMFLDGFLDRHPDLKLIACHGGGGLPYLIGRFDKMWSVGTSGRKSQHPPSHYLNKVWYDAIVYDQPTTDFLVAQVGADRVLYGSDYPFLIADPVGVLARIDALPPDQRDAIRGGNTMKLFDLKV